METLFIGKNLLFLHDVESTNTYAMNLLRNVNVIEGTVVYTDNQTSGRGQRGALWISNVGQNITSSIILKPTFLPIDNVFYLSKISALAVYDLLTDILPISQYDIKIKWSNDILVNQQKIAGILIENNFTSINIQYSVIGIGLNVNQDTFSEFERSATSLKLISNMVFEREKILNLLCEKLEKWYLKLKEGKTELIDKCYHDHLYEINKITVFVDVNHHKFNGRIKSVTKAGKLLLELENNLLKEFDIKEVKFLS